MRFWGELTTSYSAVSFLSSTHFSSEYSPSVKRSDANSFCPKDVNVSFIYLPVSICLKYATKFSPFISEKLATIFTVTVYVSADAVVQKLVISTNIVSIKVNIFLFITFSPLCQISYYLSDFCCCVFIIIEHIT